MNRTWLTAIAGVVVAAAMGGWALLTADALGQAGQDAHLGDWPASSSGAPLQQPGVPRQVAGRLPSGKEFRGRLPPHFGQVVNEEQRQRIYAIQREYAARIDVLKAQLEAIEAERDARVYSVLTPPQRQRVEILKRQSQTKNSAPADAQRWPIAPMSRVSPVGR